MKKFANKFLLLAYLILFNMTFDNASPCQKILDNNSEYIVSLYKSCFDKVKGMVIKNSGTEQEAKDVFQDALEVLLQNCQKSDFKLENVQPCTYLYKTSWYKWLKKLKENKRIVKDMPELPDEGISITDNLNMQRERLFTKYFLKLDHDQQKAIEFYQNGVPGKVAAEKIGKTEGGYRQFLMHAKAELTNRVQEDELWKELKS